MNELKQKALAKMLKEMESEHTSNEDAIHNWLCEQEDDQLFKGILEEGKSIKKALKSCTEKAKKKAKNGVAMIDDKTVFGWVFTYFTGEKKKVAKKLPVKPVPKKRKHTDATMEGLEQMSLFDNL